MTPDYSLEVFRRIYNDRDGDFIEIRPDPDGLDALCLRSYDKDTKTLYGEVKIYTRVQLDLVIAGLQMARDEMFPTK